jgi:A/G-specific adenine glycosylase
MELGALVCTAASPSCTSCPLQSSCRWHTDGRPAYDGPVRKAQTYAGTDRHAGTDRQCRGRLLGVVRDAREPVRRSRLDAVWSDAAQRERCLAWLVEDGLLTQVAPGFFALP